MPHSTPPDPATQTLWARLNGACEQLWTPMQGLLSSHSLGRPKHDFTPSGGLAQPGLGALPSQSGRGDLSMEVVGTIDSTNSELMRRARLGQTDPVLLVAVNQTAGRGRMGKTWQSTVGASLTFSLGLPLQPADWSGLSLAVGVSVAESLAALLARTPLNAGVQAPPAVQLKWPNDLWIGGKKAVGILIETANAGGDRFVVIGVGINIAPPASMPAALVVPLSGHVALPPVPPTGLAEFADALDAADALASVLPQLLADVLAFEARGFAAFTQRFAARDALAHQPLLLSDGTQGMGQGVDATGALQVLTAQGLRSVNSAEVSVRPVASTETGHPC